MRVGQVSHTFELIMSVKSDQMQQMWYRWKAETSSNQCGLVYKLFCSIYRLEIVESVPDYGEIHENRHFVAVNRH